MKTITIMKSCLFKGNINMELMEKKTIKGKIKFVKCESCGYTGLVNILDDEPTECPACGHCSLHETIEP